MPFSSSRNLGRVDTNASPAPSRAPPPSERQDPPRSPPPPTASTPSPPPMPPPALPPPSDGQDGQGGQGKKNGQVDGQGEKGWSPLAPEQERQLSAPPASQISTPSTEGQLSEASTSAAAGAIEIDPALLDDDALFGMME